MTPALGVGAFRLKTGKRVYHLHASKKEDKEQWIKGLEEINKFYQEHPDQLSIIREGFLMKKGPRGMKAWKKRLCTLMSE